MSGTCRTLASKALQGDLTAREQLRSLLAPIDFKLTGKPDKGLLAVIGGRSVDIDLPDRERDATDDPMRAREADFMAVASVPRSLLAACREKTVRSPGKRPYRAWSTAFFGISAR
jgi:hypothetical protein